MKALIYTGKGQTMGIQKLSPGIIIAVVAIAGLFLTLTTAGLLSVNQSIPTSGTLSTVNVGVYSNIACTQQLTSISWGSLAPGGTAATTVYVKNTGTNQITLTMTRTNWNPAGANGPISVTWDKESTTLTANQVATATLTLSVSSSISGITTFSVDIVITGTG
jgi:hypothetical protein